MVSQQRMAQTAAARQTTPFGWKFVAPLYAGSALNPVNSSIIATALVPIAAALHISAGDTTVLVSTLYLASAVAQPTAGKLAEEFGPRRVFLTGITLVLIGGVVGGLGHNLDTLVTARVLIGLGTSAAYPSAMVMVARRATSAGMSAPPGGVLGGLAIAGLTTAAIGPPIGGLLVGTFGWRAAFLVNVPVALTTLAMALTWLPRDVPQARGRRLGEIAARIDIVGIFGFAGATTALLVFLMKLPHVNWTALGVLVVLAVALLRWELRVDTPFFDIRGLVTNTALSRTYLRTALTLLGAYTVLFGLTQWLQGGRGMSAWEAGLFLLPMGALSALVSWPLSRRNLVRGPLITAALSMLAASVIILFLTTHSPVVLVAMVTLLFGITLGAATSGNQTALYAHASAGQIGTASGLFRTFGYFGSIASATITGAVFRNDVTDHGLHTLALVLVGTGAVVLAMTLLDRSLKVSTTSRIHPNPNDSEEHA